jgi:hypothetical protein
MKQEKLQQSIDAFLQDSLFQVRLGTATRSEHSAGFLSLITPRQLRRQLRPARLHREGIVHKRDAVHVGNIVYEDQRAKEAYHEALEQFGAEDYDNNDAFMDSLLDPEKNEITKEYALQELDECMDAFFTPHAQVTGNDLHEGIVVLTSGSCYTLTPEETKVFLRMGRENPIHAMRFAKALSSPEQIQLNGLAKLAGHAVYVKGVRASSSSESVSLSLTQQHIPLSDKLLSAVGLVAVMDELFGLGSSEHKRKMNAYYTTRHAHLDLGTGSVQYQ